MTRSLRREGELDGSLESGSPEALAKHLYPFATKRGSSLQWVIPLSPS